MSQAPNVLSHASQLTQLHLDTSSNLDDTIAAKVVMPKKMIWPAVPLSPDSALKDCSMNTEEGVTLKQCANTTANDVLMDDTNPTFKPDLSLATSWTAPSYHSSTTPFANAPSLKTPSSIPPLSFTAIQEQKTHDLTMARTASTTSSAMVATPSAGSEASGSVYTPSLSGDSSSGQVSPQMFVPNTTAAGSALDSSRKNKNDSDIHEHSKIKGIPRGQSATSQSALVSTAQEDTLSQSRTLPVQVQPNQEQTKKPRKKASSRNSLALAPIPSPGLNCRLSVLNTPRRGSGSLTLPSSNDGNGTNASVAQHNVIHLPTMPSLQNLRIHTSTIRGRRQSRKNSTANGNSTSITPAIATGGNAALDKATIGVNALGLALPCGSAISSTVSSIDKTVAAAQSDELHQRPANEVSNLENGGRRRSSNVIGTMDFEPSTSAFTSLLPTPTPTSINFQAQDSADDSALAIPSTSELHTVQLNVRSPVSREEDPFLLPSGAVASSDVIKNNMKLLNHVEGRQRRGTYLTDFPSEHGRNMLDMMYDPGAPLHFEHQMQMWMAPYHQQFLNHQLHQQQMSAGYPQYGYTLFPPAYGGHTVPYLPGYPYSNANNQSLSVDLHTPNPYNSTYISNATASTLPYYTPLSSTSGQKRKNDMMEHVDTLPQYVTNFVDQQVNIQSGGNVPRSTFGFGYVNQPNQWSTNKKNFISELQQDHSTQQTSPSTFIGNTLHTVDTTAKRARLE